MRTQSLVLMQMTFLNNVRKVGRLVLSRTSCLFMGFARFSVITGIISLNSVNQLVFVMVKCGVFFAVRTEFLSII
jgi:hypothetical protein